MKRIMLTTLLLVLSSTTLFCEYEERVPKTATIDSLTLNAIRDACHPNSGHSNYDVVLRNYWCNYISITDTLNRDDMLANERYDDFSTYDYSREAFWGAVGIGYDILKLET